MQITLPPLLRIQPKNHQTYEEGNKAITNGVGIRKDEMTISSMLLTDLC